jgi:transcription termination/antitermination protein NusG
MATKRTRSATLVPDEIPSELPEDEAAASPAAEAETPAEETDELSPATEGHQWYVIHTYSGYESKVKQNLEHRIETMDAKGLILQVVIPTEDEIEIREGQRRTVSKKIFPGYVLVQMIELKEGDEASNKAWYVVRNTPGVTGFVGSGARPVPLDDNEVKQILRQMRVEEPRVKVGFQVGQSVRIIDGPFIDFAGQVNDINLEKGKVKVLVSFFGRETPVELDFLEVERL